MDVAARLVLASLLTMGGVALGQTTQPNRTTSPARSPATAPGTAPASAPASRPVSSQPAPTVPVSKPASPATGPASAPAPPPPVASAPASRPASRPVAAPGLALDDGDVIVFLGDELTEAAQPRTSYNFPTLVETFLTVRYPDRRLSFINAGWSHDTAARAGLRLERDVLAHGPTVVVICLGLNDPAYEPFTEERLAAFGRDLRTLVTRCRAAGARTWLISPPSIEEDRGQRARIVRDQRRSFADLGAIGYHETLGRYGETVRDVAAETQSGFVDWYTQSARIRRRLRRHQRSFGFTRDGRLPLARGHALVAAALLQAWQAEPIEVAVHLDWEKGVAELDAPAPGAVAVEITDDGRRIVRLEQVAMPWPMPSGRFGALEVDWTAAKMCRFILRVANPPERGVIVSGATDKASGYRPRPSNVVQLQAGVNLAASPPVRSLQATADLFNLIGTKNLYRYAVWRRLEPSPPQEPELIEAHGMLIDTWKAYAEGYAEVIRHRPKLIDLELVLSENVKPEQLPTSRPARAPIRPARRSIPLRPAPATQSAPAAR